VTLNSSLRLVDTHCHLNFNEFDQDRVQVLKRARENGISRILNPGIDIETSKTALKCSVDYHDVYVAVGVHPNSGMSWTMSTLSELRQLADEQKVRAIGEIGLDYYRDYTPKGLQRSIFSMQLELAAELRLPVIVHNREASEDILDILNNWYHALVASGSELACHPGVMHSFSGTVEFAKACISLNFKLVISGPVTFRNSQEVNSLPLENLLIETDAPYLTPDPYRGKRNEPANVRIVAEKIAELKDYPVDEVAKITTEEAYKLFNWRVIN
jgi:TatD DNase family protein